MAFENDGGLFTFIWEIENTGMNMKKRGEKFRSPAFAIKKFSNTKWFLSLYPKGDLRANEGNVSCFLNYSGSTEGPQEIEINFEIYLVENIITLPKFEKSGPQIFQKDEVYGYPNIEKDFLNSQNKFPEKIYIICYIWMSDADIKSCTVNDSKITAALIPNYLQANSMPQECSRGIHSYVNKDIREIKKKLCYFPNYCFARSFIPTERKSLSWPLVDITEDKNLSIIVMTISDLPDLSVTVFRDENDSIQVSILNVQMNSEVAFVSVCKISVSDSSGKIRHSIEKEHCFESKNSSCWNFELQYQNSEGNEPFELSLCHLYCEITISKGEIVSFIEENYKSHTWCNPDIVVNKNASSESKLQGKMAEMYISKLFCDVTLRLPDKIFEAHKAILCGNSPVFKAMFQNDMKENKTDVVNIEDVESNTMNRMLKYMYSDSVEPMQFEESLKLYEAADKYQILSLQEKCAGLLLGNLSLKNVCAVLCLADAHQDNKLKTVVSQFILQHANEILPSEEWKIFLNDNTQLAVQILQEICMKSFHIQYKLK